MYTGKSNGGREKKEQMWDSLKYCSLRVRLGRVYKL